MKGKMKLDLGSIKNWLLAHGEKVAFAIVALVFVLFVYSALQRESLDDNFDPEKLVSLAGNVESHLTNSTWDASRENLKVVNYADRAKTREVKVEHYPLATALNPPVTDPKAKRGEPEIFAAEELRVAAGMDTFALKAEKADAAAGGDGAALKAQPWAVVTGLVPIARQTQAYNEMFVNAADHDSKTDTPQYLRPVLERSEATSAEPTWEKVADATEFEQKWRSSAPEVAAAKYVDKQLAAPLGDLASGEWGEAVSHPKVPLVGEELPQNPPPPAEDKKAADGAAQPAAVPAVEHLLLRAFDYSVQPGKKYRYRITLQLANPNADKNPRYLKDPQTAQKTVLTSPPSEPTSVVSIPDGYGVLAGAINGGSRYAEPTATILVTAIDPKTGLKAAAELSEVRRGSLANTEPGIVKARNPLNKNVQELNMALRSNILVLDINGGRVLSRRNLLTVPGEILLLDSDGNMTVRGDIEDETQYEATLVKDATSAEPERALEQPQRIRPASR